jgi:deoxyribodipyrimidine photo-lyase
VGTGRGVGRLAPPFAARARCRFACARIATAGVRRRIARHLAACRCADPGRSGVLEPSLRTAIEARDATIKRALRAAGLRAESHNAALLVEPWQVQTRTGDPYRVFTPFWRSVLGQWRLPASTDAPAQLPRPAMVQGAVPIEALALAPARDWDQGFWTAWVPGEHGANAAIESFIASALGDYPAGRDRPDRIGTSRLSPHLHFGEIAPWRVVRLLDAAGGGAQLDGYVRDAYVRELGWREFAHHLLHHFPLTPDANFNPRFDDFPWAKPSARQLQAWQRGRTGIPIVDAGMRELWHTGWMHNRVRMIVASFLTKNLRLHWEHGARWFWDTLVDADLANNTLGWQWVAGTGADAAPYYRVFNPVLQAQKFDPRGDYIARWVPELAQLAPAQRHQPWTGVIPRGYVKPLVDLAENPQGRAGRTCAQPALASAHARRVGILSNAARANRLPAPTLRCRLRCCARR